MDSSALLDAAVRSRTTTADQEAKTSPTPVTKSKKTTSLTAKLKSPAPITRAKKLSLDKTAAEKGVIHFRQVFIYWLLFTLLVERDWLSALAVIILLQLALISAIFWTSSSDVASVKSLTCKLIQTRWVLVKSPVCECGQQQTTSRHVTVDRMWWRFAVVSWGTRQ